MPGPKNFKATKLGIIIDEQIARNDNNLQCCFDLLDNLCIRYEIINKHSPDELIQYASLAKQRGIECVIVVADVHNNLPALCAKVCAVPVIFAPFTDCNRRVPRKILASGPFCVTAANHADFAALFAAKIIAIRDKSLSRRMRQLMPH